MPPGRKRIYPLGTTLTQKILMDLKKSPDKPSSSQAKIAEKLRSPYHLSPGTSSCPLKDVSVWEIAPPKRAARALRNINITTVGQLLATPIEALMSQWSFGRLSMEVIQEALCRLLFPVKGDQDKSPLDYSSFERMVISLTEVVLPKCRTAIVLIERLGLRGKCPTLASLGVRFGISRERIRQIQVAGINILASPPNRRKLRRFWEEVWAILEPAVEPYSVFRVAESLRKRFGWQELPPAKPLAEILKLHPEIAIDRQNDVSINR